MTISIDILDYLTEDILRKIINDLEESNQRKIKDYDFTFSEIELNVKWGGNSNEQSN